MKKSRDLFEHLKTGILVVLFLITILLLYFNLNRQGRGISFSDLLKGTQSRNIVVSAEDCLNPIRVVRSNGEGSYSICSNSLSHAVEVANSCAEKLLPASSVMITKLSGEAFVRMALEKGSIQVIFDFDYPFDDYCQAVIGKTIEHPSDFEGFSVLLFSDSIKSDLYFRDLTGECYKFSVAENYYSTDTMAQLLTFAEKTDYNSIYLVAEKELPAADMANLDQIPNRIFGDTFDFVRRIVDANGNRTYMYGYGQKRLSVYVDGTLEFKEDLLASEDTDLYTALTRSLTFIEEKTEIDDRYVHLVSAKYDNVSRIYTLVFTTGDYHMETQVGSDGISYFYMGKEAES